MGPRLPLGLLLLSFCADIAAAAAGAEAEVLAGLPPEKQGSCQLPPDQRTCGASSVRFFYNIQSGRCEKFVHKGCKGHGNNFATQLECLQACSSPAICQLPMDHGLGDVYQSRVFYNSTSGRCEEFLYKGSRGNANNFRSQETCVQLCQTPGKDFTGTSIRHRRIFPQRPRGRCPKPGGVGACAEMCFPDAPSSCPRGEICCFNGCGHQCMRPVLEVQ